VLVVRCGVSANRPSTGSHFVLVVRRPDFPRSHNTLGSTI
jgi:hypothetical protein